MSLELITGPMFSGKTLELIRRLDAAAASGSTVLAAKPALDLDSGFLVSAAGPTWPAHEVDDAFPVGSLAGRADVVGVDEAQFLAAAEVNRLIRAAAGATRVIAAGLDLDFRGSPFRSLGRLAAHARSIVRLTATCTRCGAVATRSQRLVDGAPAPSSAPRIVLGGRELYEPRCVTCHEVPQLSASS
jgi:thymidine kinase